VDRAVAAARRAFPDWEARAALERAGLLVETARRLRGNREDFALTLTRETGRTLLRIAATSTGRRPCFEYYAGLIATGVGASSLRGDGQLNLVIKEPIGVVVASFRSTTR